MSSQGERDLLEAGQKTLEHLADLSGGDPLKLSGIVERMVAEGDAPALTAAIYVALHGPHDSAHHDGRQGGSSATAALGVAAGLSGHSSDLYRAARLSSDVHAAQRSLETGDPTYAARRAKNVVVGRALGKAGVWRKLWR
ncbi:hypothetical protein [Conexibacter sp. DBS9H8]|uniref:hypothetical protein n=1 Tax=Conexibacter sp. DBS9H8 TaxID=2937801 RepID=UPI00200EB56F|nr:hypothetical protein [Conexibacter sp. DBS9H8]